MTVCSRIRWLVSAHAVLAAAPLLGLLLSFSTYTLPLMWTLVSLPLGGVMALAVWIGMGRTRLRWRVAIGLVASFYISMFPFFNEWAQDSRRLSKFERITDYMGDVTSTVVILVLFGATFMLIGRWFEIAQLEPETGPQSDGRLRFSMFQLMVVMSVVAIVVSLSRLARAATGHRPSTWETIAIYSFMFATFLVNTACAAFAALGTGNVRRNVVFVLAVSILLGAAAAVAMHNEMLAWWLFGGTMLIVIVPTATVLVSLLIVRSCGYRLLRR